MLRLVSLAVAALALAACANLEPAGRNASRAPQPEQATAPLPAPQPAPQAEVAAPNVTTAVPTPQPEPQTQRRSEGGGDDIVVPGQTERQVPAPRGDPRSTSERMEDIRSWDQCVSRAQGAFDGDPMRPQLQSPEETCSEVLGMASRNAVPESRLRR